MTTGTLGSQARDYHQRQTHYLAANISGVAGSNFALQGATFKLGTVPANATIIRAGFSVGTVFNNGTLNQLSIGNAASGAQIVATVAGLATLGLAAAMTVIGSAAGPMAADQDIWVTNQSTGTQGTAGAAVVWVEYIVVNNPGN